MDERDRFPSELAERFQVRLPAGLRDRIKAYAESHGRSMNSEIVRILEREFPEPWPLDQRAADLLKMTKILKDGVGVDLVDQLADAVHESLRGIVTGRVVGVDEGTRARIREELDRFELGAVQDEEIRRDFDDGEVDAYGRSGKIPR